jgi:hypothetical protein
MTPLPRRPRGRPPVDPATKSVDVHVKLPPKVYDQVWALARAHDLSIPEVVRRSMRLPPVPE